MPAKFAFAVIVALLAASVLAAVAQNTTRDSDVRFRTVRGIVVADDADARPLRQVRIVVTGGAIVANPVYTDAEGRFEILVPTAAPFGLTFTKPGYAPQDTARGAVDASDELRIRLAPGAAVTGRVTDQYGDPLLTRVHVRRTADETGRTVEAEWTTDSDDLGEFRVGSLPAGRFDVRIDRPSPPGSGDVPLLSSRSPVRADLRAGEESTVNFVEELEPIDPRGRVIGS